MVIDKHTNFVYLSDKLRSWKEYQPCAKRLIEIFEKHHIKYGFLKSTKDIWCRDYMPVQKDVNSFVQFRYEPSYLRDQLNYQSNPQEVCKAINISAELSPINLDGGNIIKWHDKIIITKRIFRENPGIDEKQLVKDIENLLNAQVIIIPDIEDDFTGHADGHVRFYDNTTLLVNDIKGEYVDWWSEFNKIKNEHSFHIIKIPGFEYFDKKHKHTAIGCYVNFLEVGNIIILPIFEVPGNKDQQVIDIFNDKYPGYKIIPININEVTNWGGLMNCCTWNIKTPELIVKPISNG